MTSELETAWLSEFEGKSLLGVRPEYNENDRVPGVMVSFTDNTRYLIQVKGGVFFEGCLINILRKAQPVYDVALVVDKEDTYLEVRAETFPMFVLMAQNKRIPEGEFPFVLTKQDVEWRRADQMKKDEQFVFQGVAIKIKSVYSDHGGERVGFVAYNGDKRMVTPTFANETMLEVVRHAREI